MFLYSRRVIQLCWSLGGNVQIYKWGSIHHVTKFNQLKSLTLPYKCIRSLLKVLTMHKNPPIINGNPPKSKEWPIVVWRSLWDNWTITTTANNPSNNSRVLRRKLKAFVSQLPLPLSRRRSIAKYRPHPLPWDSLPAWPLVLKPKPTFAPCRFCFDRARVKPTGSRNFTRILWVTLLSLRYLERP